MIKRAYFFATALFSFVFCGFFSDVKAQELPDGYDPLEERLKIATAYIPNYRELMR